MSDLIGWFLVALNILVGNYLMAAGIAVVILATSF